MNKLKKISIIVMLIIVIANNCSAFTKVEGTRISINKRVEVPFYYEDEGKRICEIITCQSNQVYKLQRDEDLSNSNAINGKEHSDVKLRRILSNGYPMHSERTLGCNNWEEAYIATQEAVYCKLENKDVNKYIAENEAGQRIIRAIKQILKNSQNEVIKIQEMSDWTDLSKIEKYKEYRVYFNSLINCTPNIVEGNAKITDSNGNIKQNLEHAEIFRVVLPKNEEMVAKIRLDAQVRGTYVQVFNSTANENKQYVMPEIDEITEIKEFDVESETVKVNILNKDELDNPIVGSCFDVLDLDYNVLMRNVHTDNFGKTSITLDKGKYYLKQTSVDANYELNKALLEIDIQGIRNANITITNTKLKEEEISILEKEINIKEETKQIKENNVKEVTNINNKNIYREIINETNVTNLNNVNNFINTINRKKVLNLEKENIYRNTIKEISKQNKILDGENINLSMTRSDYINYIDMIMHNKISVPILPVASK